MKSLTVCICHQEVTYRRLFLFLIIDQQQSSVQSGADLKILVREVKKLWQYIKVSELKALWPCHKWSKESKILPDLISLHDSLFVALQTSSKTLFIQTHSLFILGKKNRYTVNMQQLFHPTFDPLSSSSTYVKSEDVTVYSEMWLNHKGDLHSSFESLMSAGNSKV